MHESKVPHSSHGLEYHGLYNLNDIYWNSRQRHSTSRRWILAKGRCRTLGRWPSARATTRGAPSACVAQAAKLAAVFRENFAAYSDKVPENINTAGPA